jgi:uncharacterized protein
MQSLISATENFVKKTLADAEGGHGWWHIDRVRKMLLILKKWNG